MGGFVRKVSLALSPFSWSWRASVPFAITRTAPRLAGSSIKIDAAGHLSPAVDVRVAGRSVNFCTRQFNSSATYSSFSDGQAIS
jgi:hypothetical protein